MCAPPTYQQMKPSSGTASCGWRTRRSDTTRSRTEETWGTSPARTGPKPTRRSEPHHQLPCTSTGVQGPGFGLIPVRLLVCFPLCLQFLQDVSCPFGVQERQEALDWLLGLAVRYEYGDNGRSENMLCFRRTRNRSKKMSRLCVTAVTSKQKGFLFILVIMSICIHMRSSSAF